MAPGRTRPSIKSLAEPVETSADRGALLHQAEQHGKGADRGLMAEAEQPQEKTCSVARAHMIWKLAPRSLHPRGM